MSHGFTDWQQLGIFPLQDHEDGVPLSIRQQLVAGRITRMTDPAENDKPLESVIEFGSEKDMGTLGDMHPWLFWQTRDRAERGMGAWQSIFAGLTATGATAGPKAGRTGQPPKPATILPIKTGRVSLDGRFHEKFPGWPTCFPKIPAGTMMAVAPGMEETAQHDLMLHTDPRLVAVNAAEPGAAGTLVCDLQPEAEMCMGSDTPGKGGRHSRLQSAWRVIPLDQGHNIPGIAALNGIAWNLAASEQDSIAGLGLCYAREEGGAGGGPITHRPPRGPITQFGGGGAEGAGAGRHERDGDTPSDFGKFNAAPRGGHSVGLAAQVGGCGPLTVGAGIGDKHRIGSDKDGHGVGSMHISTNGYFFMDAQRDGPLFFEKLPWPEPKDKGFPQMVHCVWDGNARHKFINGTRDGFWKWYTKVPYFIPNGDIPRQVPPKDPDPGGPGTPVPTGPVPPGPGPGGPIPRGPITPGGPPGSPPRGRGPVTPRGGGRNGSSGTRAPDTEGLGAGGGGAEFAGGGGFATGDQNGGGGNGLPGSKPIGPQLPPPPGDWWFQTPDGAWNPTGPRGRHGQPSPFPRVRRRPALDPDHQFPLPPWLTPPRQPDPTVGIGPAGPGVQGPVLPDSGWDFRPGPYPDYDLPDDHHGPQPDADFWPPDWPWYLNPKPWWWDDVWNNSVGSTQPSDRSLFQVWHPMAEGFAEMSFRPQRMIAGALSFTHNSDVHEDLVAMDEATRPQVVTMRTWGAQNSSGEWDYQQLPQDSRARGGTAHGGVLLTPPAYELEDYFGINSAVDVDTITTASFLACAPGVGLAVGAKPASDGGLAAQSLVITQQPGGNGPLWIYQNDSARVGQSLLLAEWDDTANQARVTLSGDGAVRIPTGTDAQQPTGSNGLLRISTEDTYHVPEYWEGVAGEWVPLVPGSGSGAVPVTIAEVDFTRTDSFEYNHGFANYPNVTVVDSTGYEVETQVYHDTGLVQVYFRGTLTDAKLLLS